MERTKKPDDSTGKQLSEQVKTKVSKAKQTVKDKKEEYEGSTDVMISTGSTLLDLAISGGRVRGGGIPGGILVEVFGPSGSGKTILLCEIAGSVQRHGGQVMFHDPEARLNKQFAQMFDLNTKDIAYTIPNTIPEVFGAVRNWKGMAEGKINGVFADSLAALSTDLEMENEDGDKMGMRRAKEFSEELRRTCRVLQEKNLLMVASNQVRQNLDAGAYGQKYTTPGGVSIGFYSSLRLRMMNPEKIRIKRRVSGKDVSRTIGVETQVEVHKSSIWKPFHTAPLIIIFDYGIDDIQANLQFLKDYTDATVYSLGGEKLSKAMDDSIAMIEEDNLQDKLKEETINLWEEIESKFEKERKPKQR